MKPGVTRLGEFSLGLRLKNTAERMEDIARKIQPDEPAWSWEIRRRGANGPLASFEVPFEDGVMEHWDRAQRMLQAAVTEK